MLRLVAAKHLDARRSLGRVEVLYDQVVGGSRIALHRHEAGYLFDHAHFGRFQVAVDGSAIDCAPRALVDWVWQRFLVGQLLPAAAIMQGLEPFHASGVSLGGNAVVCAGPSGAGKSSVALHLVQRGAQFLADDVIAVEVADGAALAHPGAPLASIGVADLPGLVANSSIASWPQLGTFEDETRLIVPPISRDPVPVAAFYVLVRRPESSMLEIRPLQGDRAATLLGATFNAFYRSRDRVLNQLEVCHSLTASCSLNEVRIPPGATAGQVAVAIADDAT